MAEIVEGEWKNFIFKMVTPENKAQVYEHLKHNFYMDEPVCQYFGGSSDLCAKEFEAFYDAVIPHNLSFFAVDKDTQEVAGVRMTMVHRKESHDFSNFNFTSLPTSNVFKVVGIVDGEANFLERFRVDQVVNFVTASIDRKYRGQGLVTEMYRRSLEFLKVQGHKHVKSVITNPYTRKALYNFGFKELVKIYYKDFKGEDGTAMFPNLDKDLFTNFMYLDL